MGLVLLTGLAGCAPTTLSPMALRLAPLNPGTSHDRVGIHTGPRLSVPLSRPRDFHGDDAPFSTPQWAIAYDVQHLEPLGEQLALHLGLQAEIGCGYHSCPVPVPGYGVSIGLSHYVSLGVLSVSPAVMLRGATDFGLGIVGGPGSQVGAEASLTLGLHDGSTAVGFTPFCGVHRVFGTRGGHPGPLLRHRRHRALLPGRQRCLRAEHGPGPCRDGRGTRLDGSHLRPERQAVSG